MTRATWNDQGTRIYHAGVDRGMLYVGTLGIPWNGLIGVSEAPTGGASQGYFIDGQKYYNQSGLEEFAATITAFSTPIEFATCAGRGVLSSALYAGNQPRRPFVFSYRTLIGNDISATAFAYKVHIVFNAIAKVSDFTHGTINASPSANPYSIGVETSPVRLDGYKPMSHIVVDSRKVTNDILAEVEAILYGDDVNDPRMPTAAELVELITS